MDIIIERLIDSCVKERRLIMMDRWINRLIEMRQVNALD